MKKEIYYFVGRLTLPTISMSSAKLRLGIYYLRKSVFLIFLNNLLTTYYKRTYCLKRKNKKRFFSFQSMPNLNFAELIVYSFGKEELMQTQ